MNNQAIIRDGFSMIKGGSSKGHSGNGFAGWK
jgi:hypothetical protein